jgi:hypothetical protein
MVNDVFLYPVEGIFDVPSIEAYLKQLPDVELDPLGTGTFMVCGVPEAKALCREEREADPSRFPDVVLVSVKPEEVNVFQQYGDDHRLRSAPDIVRHSPGVWHRREGGRPGTRGPRDPRRGARAPSPAFREQGHDCERWHPAADEPLTAARLGGLSAGRRSVIAPPRCAMTRTRSLVSRPQRHPGRCDLDILI